MTSVDTGATEQENNKKDQESVDPQKGEIREN